MIKRIYLIVFLCGFFVFPCDSMRDEAETAGVERVIRMPEVQVLEEMFYNGGLGHFAEVTEIIKFLAEREITSWGILMILNLTFFKYQSSLNDTQQILLCSTKINVDKIIDHILKDDPEFRDEYLRLKMRIKVT